MLGLGRLLPGWLLSEAEVDYLKRGVALGVRDDGRAAMQLRRVEVNTSVLPHSVSVDPRAGQECGGVLRQADNVAAVQVQRHLVGTGVQAADPRALDAPWFKPLTQKGPRRNFG